MRAPPTSILKFGSGSGAEQPARKTASLRGLRHTSATLALNAGVPVKVVSQRLGHAKTDITNDIYAHALPSMQKDAAAKMAALLR